MIHLYASLLQQQAITSLGNPFVETSGFTVYWICSFNSAECSKYLLACESREKWKNCKSQMKVLYLAREQILAKAILKNVLFLRSMFQ